jgi:plasmid replication initiation protein
MTAKSSRGKGPYMYKLVRKSNKLVNSRNSFTPTQNRILLLMLAQLYENNYQMGWMDIPVQKVIDAKEKRSPQGAQYQQVKDAALGMSNSALYVKDESGHWESIPLVQAEGNDKKHTVRVKFVDVEESRRVLEDIFLKGGAGYTTYFLEIGLSFRKKYTLRIYEKLKKAHNLSPKTGKPVEYELMIDELKFELCLEDKYSDNFEFKRWVVNPAVKEINKSSDLKVQYKPNKKRNATGYIFAIEKNETVKTPFIPSEPKVLDVPFEEVKNTTSDEDKLAELRSKYDPALVDFAWEKITEVSKQKVVKSKMGYLLKALQNNYFDLDFQAHKTEIEKKQRDKQLKLEKEQELKFKRRLEQEYQEFYQQLLDAYRPKVNQEDVQSYIVERKASIIPQWKKYAQEFRDGEPSSKAWVNLLHWFIEKRGKENDRMLLDIERYMEIKHSLDWKELVINE